MQLQLIPGIHRATHRIGLYLALLREHGLAQGEAHILAHLAHSGTATVGELHKVLAHKRSTLTSILDRLVERGFVTRDAAATDRRTFVIDLTRKGRRVAIKTHRHLQDLEQTVRRQFPGDALDTFAAVLSALEEAANERISSPPPARGISASTRRVPRSRARS
jgi:DNA-binding MarR family transcriptional regulator